MSPALGHISQLFTHKNKGKVPFDVEIFLLPVKTDSEFTVKVSNHLKLRSGLDTNKKKTPVRRVKQTMCPEDSEHLKTTNNSASLITLLFPSLASLPC